VEHIDDYGVGTDIHFTIFLQLHCTYEISHLTVIVTYYTLGFIFNTEECKLQSYK